MTKKLKVAFLACLTLCIALFAFVFAACDGGNGGNDNTNDGIITYTVTVEYEDGTAPSTDLRISVQLCAVRDDGSLGLCLTPVQIDENGVAVIEIDVHTLSQTSSDITEDTIYHIQVNRVPDTHTYNQELNTSVGQSSYTVVLTEVAE